MAIRVPKIGVRVDSNTFRIARRKCCRGETVVFIPAAAKSVEAGEDYDAEEGGDNDDPDNQGR